MSQVIGIDLGTTNSCVAIPDSADIQKREDLLADRRLIPAGGALVLTDKHKAHTTPSAVWVDQDGAVLVGSKAKQMAKRSDEPPPALFFKRLMGTDQMVTAGHTVMTPEGASAHVLAHLKGIAEEVLGEPVQRAVVTVPAFFETKAKNLTTAAGERAGLEVVETLLEPVAAALTYTRTRELIDPMTFMAYDLGGGTFDDSVVTWDPDVGFENRSFDGDQYLGGYDFDWQIVKWMISQLDGYDLRLVRDDPKDYGILQQLLSVAEQAKHDLSRDLEVVIREAGIEDRASTPMNIRLELSRGIFQQMIDKQLQGTLASCDRALEKAGVSADSLDAIVMVGGSSNIPYVHELLVGRYGREPVGIDPDLCVAVGAALKAATAATRSSYLSLERPPATTSLAMIDIAGRVLGGDAVPSAAGVTAQLTSDDGTLRRWEVANAEGGFVFDDVTLQPEAENGFTVQVLVNGSPVDSQKVTVTHDWDARGGDSIPPEGDILAHDFQVAVRGDLHRIAQAGTKLPYRASTVNLETATQRGEIAIEFYEESRPIGEIVVDDLPRDLPIGSAVHVDLEFNRGWTVSATASIPSAGSRATRHARIQLPKMTVSSWAELDERHRRAESELRNAVRSAPQAKESRDIAEEIAAKLRAAEALIDERHDPVHAEHALSRTETEISALRTDQAPTLDPLLQEFEDKLEKLEQLVSRLEAESPGRGAQHRAGLHTLRADGLAAHAAGDPLNWTAANESVRAQIEQAQDDLGMRDELPPAPVIQTMIAHELRTIINTLEKANRASHGRFAAELDGLKQEAEATMATVEAVDVSLDEVASIQLQQTYHREVAPVRERVKAALDEAVGEQPTGPGADLRLPDSSIPSVGRGGE